MLFIFLSRRADLVLDEDDNDGGLQATRPRAPRSGARAPGKGGARGGGRVLTRTARRASLFFVRRSRRATSPTRGSRPHPRRVARWAAGALGARAPRTTTERLRGGGRGAGRARGRARVQRDVACLLTTVARERARARGRGGEGSGLGRVLGAHAIRGSRERVRASKEASGSLARQSAVRRQ